MARRAREHRKDIPGYDDTRPDRDERKREHRQVRHAANQILATAADPDEVTLPDVRRRRHHEVSQPADQSPHRYRVWKTKFWKRRDNYKNMKLEMDSQWPVITSHQLNDY